MEGYSYFVVQRGIFFLFFFAEYCKEMVPTAPVMICLWTLNGVTIESLKIIDKIHTRFHLVEYLTAQ